MTSAKWPAKTRCFRDYLRSPGSSYTVSGPNNIAVEHWVELPGPFPAA